MSLSQPAAAALSRSSVARDPGPSAALPVPCGHCDRPGAVSDVLARPTDRVSVLLGGRYSKDSTRLRDRFGATGAGEEMNSIPFVTRYNLNFEEFVVQCGDTFELHDAESQGRMVMLSEMPGAPAGNTVILPRATR